MDLSFDFIIMNKARNHQKTDRTSSVESGTGGTDHRAYHTQTLFDQIKEKKVCLYCESVEHKKEPILYLASIS